MLVQLQGHTHVIVVGATARIGLGDGSRLGLLAHAHGLQQGATTKRVSHVLGRTVSGAII
jgi:hypothetical protein